MQITSEDYFNSMGFIGAAKSRSLAPDVIDLEKETEEEYPSSLLEPNKLQSVSRHFEPPLAASFEHDWALITPAQSNENEWSLSRLYTNQRIATAEAIAERVVNSLESIPAEHRTRVYVSLLGKLEEKVRDQRKQLQSGELSSPRHIGSGRINGRDKENDKDRSPTEITASEGAQERLYDTVSAELWSEIFRNWASNHRKLSYEADDSRETIYEDCC
ncbi:MAG TPA: hypothetical protein VF435_16595 [Pyrinomonadaceae bacterium]